MDRFTCTKDDPWRPDRGWDKAEHPDVMLIRSNKRWGGDYFFNEYQCPHCGLIFRETVTK